jgi:hypothetical protein
MRFPHRKVFFFIVLSLFFIVAVPFAQAQAPALWRTLLVSNSTPAVGETTYITFEFGNWGSAPAVVQALSCAIGRDYGGFFGPSNDLQPLNVTDEWGQALAFSGPPSLFTIQIPRPFETLQPGESRLYTISLLAVENTNGENIVGCAASYTVNGEFYVAGDTVVVAIWR